MTAEAEQICRRANEALGQVPTLHEAIGCIDCDKLFRHGNECPYCGSKSLLNVADAIGTERIAERLNAVHAGGNE